MSQARGPLGIVKDTSCGGLGPGSTHSSRQDSGSPWAASGSIYKPGPHSLSQGGGGMEPGSGQAGAPSGSSLVQLLALHRPEVFEARPLVGPTAALRRTEGGPHSHTALPITRGAQTLPSDAKRHGPPQRRGQGPCPRAADRPKPLGQVQVCSFQRRTPRGQGLAQGHRVHPLARRGWMQALDSWPEGFPTLCTQTVCLGRSSAVPEETPGLSRIRSQTLFQDLLSRLSPQGTAAGKRQ